jgi:1-deoxy-D-xylulose-5-phosphate reductoisomerase
MAKKKILVLGCTGSIGASTLNIIENNPDLFEVVGLSAHTQEDELLALAKKFGTSAVALTGIEESLDECFKLCGQKGLVELIQNSDADLVVNGIAGASGLLPSIEAVRSGKNLALANKETIVMAGPLILDMARQKGCRILPVDSEHSAVFSMIERYGRDSLDSIVLTASGGPFRKLERKELEQVTVADALKHPTWSMGAKITIDSASMANKGLEVIEACRLFDVPPEKVEAVVHPESLIHSFIRTKDGVFYAQISHPDMRYPIFSALTWPQVREVPIQPFDFSVPREMSFFPPRYADFPMLPLAYQAVKAGGMYTVAYNSANEVAVAAFMKGGIGFMEIP